VHVPGPAASPSHLKTGHGARRRSSNESSARGSEMDNPLEKTSRMAPGHLHLHAQVHQGEWVREFSQYDAGWLHTFASRNGGDLRRADWDDLNYPARLTTLVTAGVPVLQRDNTGSVVATQTLVRERGLGLFFRDIPHLAEQLHDRAAVARVRERVWAQRFDFSFDAHADGLVEFLRSVVALAR
jgi:hypothetical protein